MRYLAIVALFATGSIFAQDFSPSFLPEMPNKEQTIDSRLEEIFGEKVGPNQRIAVPQEARDLIAQIEDMPANDLNARLEKKQRRTALKALIRPYIKRRYVGGGTTRFRMRAEEWKVLSGAAAFAHNSIRDNGTTDNIDYENHLQVIVRATEAFADTNFKDFTMAHVVGNPTLDSNKVIIPETGLSSLFRFFSEKVTKEEDTLTLVRESLPLVEILKEKNFLSNEAPKNELEISKDPELYYKIPMDFVELKDKFKVDVLESQKKQSDVFRTYLLLLEASYNSGVLRDGEIKEISTGAESKFAELSEPDRVELIKLSQKIVAQKVPQHASTIVANYEIFMSRYKQGFTTRNSASIAEETKNPFADKTAYAPLLNMFPEKPPGPGKSSGAKTHK